MRHFPLLLVTFSLFAGFAIRSEELTRSPVAATAQPGESSAPPPGLYHETLRPQDHFSAREGWLNDPNGLVYFDGKYHLFFQHTRGSRESGVKSWGHAVSPDLVHWTEVAEALEPEPEGSMWSGSAVVDTENRSGFGRDGKPPLVLIYTRAPIGNESHGQTSLAYSVDGLHFTKYEGNPVLPDPKLPNRDPRVFWYAPGKHWVLALYVEENDHHNIRFYTSGDLRHWEQASQFQGGKIGREGVASDQFLYECPDCWEMPVEGESGEKRWVLTAGNTEYMVGTFDGQTFTPETPKLPGQRGRGYYAPQTFNDEPQGRRVRIGWLQTAAPGMPFTQSMSLPSEHQLVRTPEGLRLTWSPVEELKALRARTVLSGPFTLAEREPNPLAKTNPDLLEIHAEFIPPKDGTIRFSLRGVPISYDADRGELMVGLLAIHPPLREGKLDLTLYIDRLSIEVYASGGLVYAPLPVDFDPADHFATLSVDGEAVKFDRLDVYELRSAWPEQP